VDVDGLVLANDPSVPANLRGTNPVPSFAAVVTCRTNVNGAVGVVRVTSANFPATPQGNAQIHPTLALPSPCATPSVFVPSPTGRHPGAYLPPGGTSEGWYGAGGPSHQASAAADPVHRPAAGARPAPSSPPRAAAPLPGRPGRHRQDAPRAGAGGERGQAV